jgi:hypothetical protein
MRAKHSRSQSRQAKRDLLLSKGVPVPHTNKAATQACTTL